MGGGGGGCDWAGAADRNTAALNLPPSRHRRQSGWPARQWTWAGWWGWRVVGTGGRLTPIGRTGAASRVSYLNIPGTI